MDTFTGKNSPVSTSSIETFNKKFQQTKIDYLRIKLEHHQERYEALEIKEGQLILKRLEHNQTGLLHYYLTTGLEKTREAMEKTQEKLGDLKQDLAELLEQI